MQITKSQFKKLIILQVSIFVAYIASSFFTLALLPAELQSYVESSAEKGLSTIETIVIVLALPLLVWAFQNFLALYQFRSYAPKHLLYITFISAIFYINITEAIVYTNVDAFFNDTLFLLTGFTLAIVFFSNLATEFKQPVSTE